MKHPLKLTKVALACIFLNASIVLVHGACPQFIPCPPCPPGPAGPEGPAGPNGTCTQPCVNGTSGIQSFGDWFRPEGTAEVDVLSGGLVPFPTASTTSVGIIAAPNGTGTQFTLPNIASYLVIVDIVQNGGGTRFNIQLDGSTVLGGLFTATSNNSIGPYHVIITTTSANQVLTVVNVDAQTSKIGGGAANGPQTSITIIQLN